MNFKKEAKKEIEGQRERGKRSLEGRDGIFPGRYGVLYRNNDQLKKRKKGGEDVLLEA